MISAFEDLQGYWRMDSSKGQGNRGHRSQKTVQTRNVIRLPRLCGGHWRETRVMVNVYGCA